MNEDSFIYIDEIFLRFSSIKKYKIKCNARYKNVTDDIFRY